MDKKQSVYLDLLRFSAALAVFLSHLKGLVATEIPDWIGTHGGEAVALFFVLSGFVIAFVVDVKEADWRSYAVARLARIYSVAPLALAVTFVADTVGRLIDPAGYANLIFFQPASGSSLARALTFTTEVWKGHVVFGSNEPYWSLGFECAYYFIFGLFCFVKAPWNILFGSAALLLAVPKIALYFPLWLIGVACYRLTSKHRPVIGPRAAMLAFLCTPIAYVMLHAWMAPGTTAIFLWYADPDKEVWTFIYYHALGLLFAAHLVAFDLAFRHARDWPAAATRTIRWLAGATFTIYLVHLPLLLLLNVLLPSGAPARWLIVGAPTLIATFLLAEVGERRKGRFVALFERLLKPDRARPAAHIR